MKWSLIIFIFCCKYWYCFRLFFRLNCTDECTDVKINNKNITSDFQYVVKVDEFNFPIYSLEVSENDEISFTLKNPEVGEISGCILSKDYYLNTTSHSSFWNSTGIFQEKKNDPSSPLKTINSINKIIKFKVKDLKPRTQSQSIPHQNISIKIKEKSVITINLKNIILDYEKNKFILKTKHLIGGLIQDFKWVENNSLINSLFLTYQAPPCRTKDEVELFSTDNTLNVLYSLSFEIESSQSDCQCVNQSLNCYQCKKHNYYIIPERNCMNQQNIYESNKLISEKIISILNNPASFLTIYHNSSDEYDKIVGFKNLNYELCSFTNNDQDINNIKNECLLKCPQKFFYFYPKNKTCLTECPIEAPYFDGNNCISNCKNSNYNKLLILSSNQCIDFCPESTVETNGKCIIDIGLGEQIDTIVKTNKTKEDLIEDIDSNIVEISNLNKTIEGDDFYAQVYPSDSKPTENENVSSIDFSECEKALKKFYQIPESDPILISKFDYKTENSTTNQVEYKVYDKNGNQLSMKPCEKIQINISYPINSGSNVNIENGLNYNEEGIDVFNSEDSFFNDICYSYQENGVDVPLSIRREQLYQNVTFCETGCEYGGMNYTSKKVICSCAPKSEFSTETNEERETTNNNKPFASQVFDLNIEVMKCIKLVPKWGNLSNNIGFWLIGVINLTGVIISIMSLYSGLAILFSTAHSALPKSNPSHKINVFYRLKPIFEKSPHSGFFDSKFCEIKNNVIKNNALSDTWDTNSKIDNIEKTPPQKKETHTNLLMPISKSENKSHIIKISHNFLIKTNFINYYPYSMALSKDERSFLRMFWDFFKVKYIIPRSFIRLSKYEIIEINILVVLFYLSLTFTINGLFFTNETLADNYNNQGNMSFLIDILRSIYSFLISTTLLFIVQFLTSYAPIIDTIFLEIYNEERLKVLVRNALTLVKRKIIIFIVLDFLLLILFWYYCITFCIIYSSCQLSWIKSGLTSIFLSLLVSVTVCLFISMFRKIGLKWKSERCYNISLFITKLY